MTDAPERDLPPDSIDALIARQLPDWLKQAPGEAREALHLALIRQQQSAEQLKRLLSGIPDLIAYCAPLLEEALHKEHNIHVDVRSAQLCTVVRRSYPSIFPLPPIERTVRTNSLPLLSAAMHNFAEDEIVTRPRIRRQLEAPSGAKLPVSFVLFAKLCHALDLGGRYQGLLRQHLLPADKAGDPPGHARREVEAVFEEAQRTALEAAVRVAFAKADIDERSYLQMLRIVAAKPIVPADTTVLACRQLFLLGKCIQGVVVVEWREHNGSDPAGLVVWIPGDADRPVRQQASWAALYEDLGLRLRESSYATFFMRFIGERERMAFSAVLEHLQAKTAKGAALELDGRHFALDKPLFAHLRKQHIDKILDDARVLAVPSKDEEAAARSQRLASYENAGLTLLGLAGLFVPVLGELMLGVAALQIADEVYEGYQDWQLGDREAALGHVFSVAENLAVGAAVGAGVALVRNLAPVLLDGVRVRLCSNDITPYRLAKPGDIPGNEPPHGQIRLHEGAFQVARTKDGKALAIRHPQREDAYRPLLARNGSGGWRHAMESPQEWSGEQQLLRRLGGRFADVTQAQATAVLDCTGFDEARLRQLQVENAPAPARLRDALDRYRLHALHPTIEAEAFELLVADAQEPEEVADVLLRKDFPGLTVRGAKEIRRQADGKHLEQLESAGRVPLAMAERVRWYLHDSRLDRACAGLRQEQAVNADSETLAIGLIQALAPWSESVRIELRAGSAQGALLGQAGSDAAQEVVCIVREEHGYSIHDRSPSPEAGPLTADSLMQALLLSMSDEQKLSLGSTQQQEPELIDKLAAHVRNHRDQASRLIGQVPIAGGVRPPVRFADGRLGYPLSGRGENRGQACRRGIQQVFPTLDEAQLRSYMLDLVAARVDPWTHYQTLHAQWASLREALAGWRADYGSMLDYLRRTRVINTIRRCWRRKLRRRSNGSYALEIRGEHVGSLPVLPEGLTFEHVTRLQLRDMNLETIDADFLARFPNLEVLDLRDNRLLSLPAGLEQLSELRVLRLEYNQIIMTPLDNLRVAALGNLRQLELSHNPLGNAPQVRRLLHLRQVGLRAAELDALPEDIRQVPWQGIVDLRQNRIRQVNQDLAGLRVRLEQLALHDNPIDEEGERYLDAQPGPSSRSGHRVQQSPYYRHYLTQQAQLSDWLGDDSGAQATQREAMWTNLRNEPGSEDFFNFLRDFSQSRDYHRHPVFYRGRVWNIIQACEENSELRELVFEQAGGMASCEDRLLWLLSQMEVRALVHRQTAGLTQMQSESELLALGRSLYRLQQVQEIAARRVSALRAERAGQPLLLDEIDDIETYMAYLTGLAVPLRLPAQPLHMHYPLASFVSSADIDAARLEILSSETPERLARSIREQPFWQSYLRETHAPDFSAIVEEMREMLEAYASQVESGAIDEQAYIEQCNALKQELEAKEASCIHTLTDEAFSRRPG